MNFLIEFLIDKVCKSESSPFNKYISEFPATVSISSQLSVTPAPRGQGPLLASQDTHTCINKIKIFLNYSLVVLNVFSVLQLFSR